MADVVFQGPAALTLDDKGRIAFPARHRALLEPFCANQLTITRHPVGCLLIFPRPTWEAFRAKLNALPQSAASWKNFYLGNAMDAEIDKSSRLLIAPELRMAVGLARDVMLRGIGSHFDLWDVTRLAEHEAKVMASEMPEPLQGSTI